MPIYWHYFVVNNNTSLLIKLHQSIAGSDVCVSAEWFHWWLPANNILFKSADIMRSVKHDITIQTKHDVYIPQLRIFVSMDISIGK